MKTKLSALAIATLISTSANAVDINWNGFASIVAGQTLSSGDSVYGFDDDISFDKGSLIALQASADLGSGLGVTAQLLAKGDNDWDPDFAWAYLSYDFNDNLRMLVGRQRAPFYMYSDFLDVSYAYPWITPPEGVYSLPFDTFDGVGFIYTAALGSFDTTTHFTYGSNDNEAVIAGDVVKPNFDDIAALSFTASRDWFTFRVAYAVATSTIPVAGVDALAAGWSQTPFASIGDLLKVENDDGKFLEVGFQIDYNDWLVNAEYTEIDAGDNFLNNNDSYYVMLGKRVNSVTYHFTVGKDNNDGVILTNDVPVGVDPTLDFLIANTNGATQSQKEDTMFYTLGARWDFHDSAALKFEYTDFSDDLDSNGDASLLRMALVTVF
ncbi:hypothetical protein LP316_07520 [Thalassotalea sp. LPB0316]|uniref:hypothetical protein n=1 Tax=Thalassotalea sp. LPB0316 TaxID=2769490 RepID=UPI0018677087|nr:hypothetical protein [Thalassotalea sp. LPB0316]QOL27128.1 hypothetical protein LP316_07520 [Thalassotalea sp. LPB0316]